MNENDKSLLVEIVKKLDELLDSDDLPTDDWHIINKAFHSLENLIED